jgi:hypothetical protein
MNGEIKILNFGDPLKHVHAVAGTAEHLPYVGKTEQHFQTFGTNTIQ